MSRPTIIINELDAERIDRLLEKAEFASLPVADALNEELDRAQVLAAAETVRGQLQSMPAGMSARVCLNVAPAEVRDLGGQVEVVGGMVTRPDEWAQAETGTLTFGAGWK